VKTLRADVPPELDDFIARLLSRDPADRPASAQSVATTLSRWAGGNLAARVAELKTGNEDFEDNSVIAQRSLSELLSQGLVATTEQPPAAKSSDPKPRRRWAGRKIAGLIATAALVGGLLFGVTILLKTREGTLKIDSEVGDVKVELVDERDQAHPLEIHRGNNETTLRAGAYRVRFASEHDGIVVEPDVLTLKHGEQTVARITRIPAAKEPVSVTSATSVTSTVATTPPKSTDPFSARRTTPGPLYEGVSEDEWQRIFGRETSPIAKLDEAVALITLSAELPAKARIERILSVGAEIVHATFGDDLIGFALADPATPPVHAPRWDLTKPDQNRVDVYRPARFGRGRRQVQAQPAPATDSLHGAYARFQSLVSREIQTIAAEPLADELSLAVRQGPSARAAFAASLLRRPARALIRESPAACQTVLRQLDLPLGPADWWILCLVVRANYAGALSNEPLQKISGQIEELAKRLQEGGVTPTTEMARNDLIEALRFQPKGGWRKDVRRAAAELVLDEIVRGKRTFWDASDTSGIGGFARFADRTYEEVARERTALFLDQWLEVANAYLAHRFSPPFDRSVREVVGSVCWTGNLYSEKDHWPEAQSAELLTKYLRNYYGDNPDGATDQPITDVLPAMPNALLTHIVRVTGEVPEFVKTGYPRVRAIAKNRQALAAAIKAGQAAQLQSPAQQIMRNMQSGRQTESVADLITEDPYGVLKLAVQPRAKDRPRPKPGYYDPFAPSDVVRATARQSADLDPLLYLAILTDLTGSNADQDDQIATLIQRWQPGTDVHVGLEDILAVDRVAGGQARRLLKAMAAKAKSPALVDAMRELNRRLLPQAAPKAEPKSTSGVPTLP
jgi:hypothetical protein